MVRQLINLFIYKFINQSVNRLINQSILELFLVVSSVGLLITYNGQELTEAWP